MMSHYALKKLMIQWKNECKLKSPVMFHYSKSTNVLTICTDRPGIMIGLHGQTVDKYREKLKELDSNFEQVEFIEGDIV